MLRALSVAGAAAALTIAGALAVAMPAPAAAAPAAGPAVPVPPRSGGGGNPFGDDSDGDDDASGAEEPGGADDEEGEESTPSTLHALTCLEGDAAGAGRRKGVQRRDFLKRHRFELSGMGGFYASDTLSSTYSYGGALSFFPSEDFGLELMVTRSPVRFRLEEPFSAFDKETHFPPGVAWQGIASMLWSPIHAKLRFSDDNIVHGDLFLVAGAGRTMHESVQGVTWAVGGGIKLYLSRLVTLRVDVRDFLLPQEVLGQARVTNNVTILAGVSLWLL
ncbi:MAG TPA: outer membrane beta-barrel domain-containing protein [Polyangia bacterium]|nr:outer membrane beta-barrel domain-containing protein [Polyangia bacterium]